MAGVLSASYRVMVFGGSYRLLRSKSDISIERDLETVRCVWSEQTAAKKGDPCSA